MKILLSVMLIASLSVLSLAQGPKFEKQAVELVQRTPVSAMEEEMPRRPFADWLRELVGEKAGIVWQLSECEQAIGVREPGSDMPACVEANAVLPDGRKVAVMVAVGTFNKGVTGAPGFYYAVIEQRQQLYSLNRLRDLPEGLSAPDSLREKAELKLVYSENIAQAALAISASAVPVRKSGGEPPPSPAEAPVPAPKRKVRRVSEGSLIGRAVKKVPPVFPPTAKKVNAWGEVQVLVTISETGSVMDARAVSGHLLLRNAAVVASREWVFTPTLLNGAPVSAQGIITFIFDRP